MHASGGPGRCCPNIFDGRVNVGGGGVSVAVNAVCCIGGRAWVQSRCAASCLEGQENKGKH